MTTPFTPGLLVGSYRLGHQIGAGGMGRVFEAVDERLGRHVALKVLPSEVATEPERLARFAREARATSALNHPNVLTVFDIGEHEGHPYLVCELLQGETLRAVIDRGEVPAGRALDYARQLAAGLGVAHEQGIVHRDVKPENVFLTTDGRIKVLDFGLATETSPAAGAAATRTALTSAGAVLGTVGYMSPEQVQGLPTDARSDIFSLGVVLYELLTGRRPFAGESPVDVLHAVVRLEAPDPAAMVPTLTAGVSRVVARCLAKSPSQRFQTASDLGFALDTLASVPSRPSSSVTPVSAPSGPVPPRPTWRLAAAAFVTGVVVAALAGLALGPRAGAAKAATATTDSDERRSLSLLPPAGTDFGQVSLSPDGRWLAFTATAGARRQLWVRPLASDAAVALEGTDGAAYPFWAPDSTNIGFFSSGRLRTISRLGGTAIAVAEVLNGTGGSWNAAGDVLYSSLALRRIMRVASSGATPVVAVEADGPQADLHDPYFLPDGRHFLYMADASDKDAVGVYLASLDGGAPRRLLPDASNVAYVDAGPAAGVLLFARDGALLGQAFDPSSGVLSGAPQAVAPSVGDDFGVTTSYRRKAFTASRNGLVVLDATHNRQQARVRWLSRAGDVLRSFDDLDAANRVDLAPDGRRFVVSRNRPATNNDLWLADVDGGPATRFTFDLGNDQYGLWAPDGRSIAWASNRRGAFDLYTKDVARLDRDVPLLLGESPYKFPTGWAHDGRSLLYRIVVSGRQDTWVMPLDGGAPRPVLNGPANETAAAFSPDDRWVTFQSDEGGRFEVYVQRLDGSGKRQVSEGGGVEPRWRGDGRELIYYAADGRLMAVPVSGGDDLSFGSPQPLFPFVSYGASPSYSVNRSGDRFLISTLVMRPNAAMTVLQGWAPSRPSSEERR